MNPNMNPELLRQMAQAAGTDPDDWMARMQAAGASNPWLALMGEMMQQREAEAQEAAELTDCRRRLSRAREVIGHLRQELEAAHVIVNYISQVFGACPHCWGQDPSCRQCGGRGAPGAFAPQEDELLAWAEPALNRLGRSIEHTRPRAPEPGSPPPIERDRPHRENGSGRRNLAGNHPI